MQADVLLAPKRESEAATRAMEELEELLTRPEPQTALVLVAARSTSGAECSAADNTATLVECGSIRKSGRRRALGAEPLAAAGAHLDPAGARLAGRARRDGCQAFAGRNRSPAALRPRQKVITLADVKEIIAPQHSRMTGR